MKDFYKDYNYKASQTAIKDFEKETTCPWRWKRQWLEDDISFVPSLPMIQGLYFEQLVIGSSAKDEKYEMPLNRDKSKKVAQVRIEEQAEYCKEVLFNKDFDDYIGKHVGIDIEWKEFQYVIVHDNKRIVIDMLGDCDEGIVMADLKLTADVNNVFGGYTWGKISNMDLFQQGFYQRVFEESHGEDIVKNLLIVFDHSPRKGKKIFDLSISDDTRVTITERIKDFEDVVDYYEKKGWRLLPSIDECEGCPLECQYRITEEKVVSESV
jgi:hypothetical protein